MDLIINQVMQLQVMHVSDCNWAIKVLTSSAVTKLYLTITTDWYTFPKLSMLLVFNQILHYFWLKNILILLLEVIQGCIYIVISDLKEITDIVLVCTVEYWSLNIETKYFCSQGEMNLKDLTNVHT